MITYWVTETGAFGMEEWLLRRAPELSPRIRVRRYESMTPALEIQSGAHIFSALDQLGPQGLATVAGLWDELARQAPSLRLLNDPRRAARRRELLRRLFEAGINRHRAHGTQDDPRGFRFPVFLREESGHSGPLTGLLRSPAELTEALRALRVRGFPGEELLVVEFSDVAGPDGRYQSAAACRVGDRIVPAHLLRGRHWVLKWDDSEHDEATMRAFRDYTASNPHADWVRRVFELAEVDYGRLDYGIQGDTLVAWEINLNPTIGPTPGGRRGDPFPEPIESLMWEGRQFYVRGLSDGLLRLDPEADDRTIEVGLDSSLVAGMHEELDRVRRRRSRLSLLHHLYEQPVLGWPLRKMLAWLFPAVGR